MRPRRATSVVLSRVATLVVLLLAISSANATMVLRYDFESMVAAADGIVHARVLDTSSTWVDGRIVTYVTLEILDCLKGDERVGDEMVVFQAGGVVDDLAQRVLGAPHFRIEDEVVVFLEARLGAAEPLVLGLSQGLFTVNIDGASGERMLTRDLTNLELVTVDAEIMDRLAVPATPVSTPESTTSGQTEVLVDPMDPIEVDTLELVEPLWVPLDTFLTDVRRTLEAQQ